MRQCCSQSLHWCTVMVTQQPAVAGRQKSEISACQQAPAQLTPPMGRVSLKLFYDGTTILSFGQGSNLLWTHTLRPFIACPLR